MPIRWWAGSSLPTYSPSSVPSWTRSAGPACSSSRPSAPFWLRDQPLADGAAGALTAIRFLPTGVQLAQLGNPGDYSAAPDRAWQLLVMPFLGRLQPESVQAPTSPLQSDPVLLLSGGSPAGGRQRTLALLLANRGDAAPVSFDVAGFEGLATRAVARLDRATLEENWLRLQWLPQQAGAGEASSAFPGIASELPNSPARLSRDPALRRMLDAARPGYPPMMPGRDYEPPPPVHGAALVWRQAALLLLEGVVRPHDSTGSLPYAWRYAALPLNQFAAGGLGAGQRSALERYPAVTILPAWSATAAQPVGFAVSPYLALDYRVRNGGTPENPALRVDELLALDPAARTPASVLRPVATLAVDAEGNAVTRDLRSDTVERWALETARRLAPQSAVLVLRTKAIDRDMDGWPTLDYAFRVLNPLRSGAALARRTVRLRTTVRGLRFRQGQFNPAAMPASLQPFEVAPPQVIGLQPLYLIAAPPAAGGDPDNWPWGLTALRAAIRYTEGDRGVAGEPAAPDGSAGVVWWQSVQAGVQYREASKDVRPAASLPRLFRSRSIRALLPVNAQAPLPDVTASLVDGPAGARWQPVLPGRLRYLLTGCRAGAPLALRHMLMRQDEPAAALPSVVSGSVPVQHRSPRPVPLPPNRPGAEGVALQTWASCFEPQATGIFARGPVDVTLTAPAGRAAYGGRLVLVEPRFGRIDVDWTGTAVFSLTAFGGGEWEPECVLTGDGVNLAMRTVRTDGMWSAGLDPADAARLRDLLPCVRGLGVRLKPAGPEDGRCEQFASLPLTYAPAGFRLPLAPVFVHFEDPEYNRRLGSAAGSAEALLMVARPAPGEIGPSLVPLSTDRRVYNPQSYLTFRYDWSDPAAVLQPDAASITLTRIRPGGVADRLAVWPSAADGAVPAAGRACTISLATLAARKGGGLRAGERIEIKLGFGADPATAGLAMEVDIVEEPVVPAPEAGYALLRRHDGVVEAARFAWNPQAAHVELVCPDDIRQGFVRRRAVFEWQDAVRAGRPVMYAIQKIAQGGSTHCPPEGAFTTAPAG